MKKKSLVLVRKHCGGAFAFIFLFPLYWRDVCIFWLLVSDLGLQFI